MSVSGPLSTLIDLLHKFGIGERLDKKWSCAMADEEV